MHLADAFIQSDLQCSQAIIFFVSICVPWKIEPTTFCAANAMLYHWATGTHYNIDSTSVKITFCIPLSKSCSWGVPLCRNVHLGRIWVSPSGTPPLPSSGPQNRPKPPHPPYGAPDIYINTYTHRMPSVSIGTVKTKLLCLLWTQSH